MRELSHSLPHKYLMLDSSHDPLRAFDREKSIAAGNVGKPTLRSGRLWLAQRAEPGQGLVQLGEQAGHDLGYRADSVHPAHDLADWHRNHIWIA